MRNLEAFEFEVFGGCMIRAAEPQVAALLSLPESLDTEAHQCRCL